MSNIISYYEKELLSLKNAGKAFAKIYPDVAHRVGLEDLQDPNIKRLIESFSFLAARLHLRADEHFRELAPSLLKTIAPHFLQPFPSMSIVQFSDVKTKSFVPRHTPLFYNTDELCTFRTMYPLELAPVTLNEVDSVSKHAYQIKTTWQDRFLDLPPYFLRFKLEGICEALTFYLQHPDTFSRIYENIFFYKRVLISHDGQEATLLPESSLHLLGFDRDETALLPTGSHQHILLQEFFHFPEKFMFASVKPLQTNGSFELLFPIKDKIPFTRDHVFLNCAPMVNLFPQTLEPIRLTHQKAFFPLIPHANRKMDIYHIESVHALLKKEKIFIPSLEKQEEDFFWFTKYQDDHPYISIVDPRSQIHEDAILHILALCTNQDTPHEIPPYSPLEIELPLQAKPICLKRPTLSFYPNLENEMLWHIVHFLTTCETDIQRILPLYGYKKQIGVEIKDKVRRIGTDAWRGFIKGKEITVTIEDFLLGEVLRHYFNLIADVHSFIDTKIVLA